MATESLWKYMDFIKLSNRTICAELLCRTLLLAPPHLICHKIIVEDILSTDKVKFIVKYKI